MGANDRQVGGDHYQTGYQPWDLIVKIPVGYLEGNVIRYVARWRKKNGLQDLEKGMHYLDKLIETADYERVRYLRSLVSEDIVIEVHNFCKCNQLSSLEQECVLFMCLYRTVSDLKYARGKLAEIIQITKVRASDDGPQYDQENAD